MCVCVWGQSLNFFLLFLRQSCAGPFSVHMNQADQALERAMRNMPSEHPDSIRKYVLACITALSQSPRKSAALVFNQLERDEETAAWAKKLETAAKTHIQRQKYCLKCEVWTNAPHLIVSLAKNE